VSGCEFNHEVHSPDHTGKKRELFAWAHAVAQRHTGKAEAWYAVGCYYLVIGKLESARTYLSKATTLAPPAEAGPAWYPSPLPIASPPRRVFLLLA
jgi:cytochrome c-type biogenesis protein CcmH/NrfG